MIRNRFFSTLVPKQSVPLREFAHGHLAPHTLTNRLGDFMNPRFRKWTVEVVIDHMKTIDRHVLESGGNLGTKHLQPQCTQRPGNPVKTPLGMIATHQHSQLQRPRLGLKRPVHSHVVSLQAPDRCQIVGDRLRAGRDEIV